MSNQENGGLQVSVVMAVFNGERTLEATLASVLEQSGCSLEFIVVDDGSTDGTPAILERAATSDARLLVIRQANAGLTRALIAGCEAARAPYIARQDCGDRSLPGRLCQQRDALDANPNVVFCSCVTRYVTRENSLLYESGDRDAQPVPITILDPGAEWGVSTGPSHHGSVMMRRDAYTQVGGYRPDFYYGQDWDLWYRLAEAGRFIGLSDALYQATLEPSDLSLRNRARQAEIGKLALEAHRLRSRGDSDEAALAQVRTIRPGRSSTAQDAPGAGEYFIGECLRRQRDLDGAATYFRAATRVNPLRVRAWVRRVQLLVGL